MIIIISANMFSAGATSSELINMAASISIEPGSIAVNHDG